MNNIRLRITRIGNEVTFYCWEPSEGAMKILEQHFIGDVDIQFDFEKEKWYKKYLSYLLKLFNKA